MEQPRRRLTIDLLYLGGATVAALMVGTFLMKGNSVPAVAQASPSPVPHTSPAPSASPSRAPVLEPDNCPACGMAVRSERDQDFIQRTQQQRKPRKT